MSFCTQLRIVTSRSCHDEQHNEHLAPYLSTARTAKHASESIEASSLLLRVCVLRKRRGAWVPWRRTG
eukprot:6201361-Pleurochrysis_carterae.AAC.2